MDRALAMRVLRRKSIKRKQLPLSEAVPIDLEMIRWCRFLGVPYSAGGLSQRRHP